MDEGPRSMNHMCPVLFRRSLYLFLPPRCRGDHYLDWNYFIIEIIIEIILSLSGRPFLGLKLFFSSDPDLNEGCKILSGQSSWSYFKRGFTGFFYWLIYHKFVPHTWIFKTINGILSPIYLNFRGLMYTMMIMIVWRPQWVWWALWEIVLAESRRRWSYLLLLTDVIMQNNAE